MTVCIYALENEAKVKLGEVSWDPVGETVLLSTDQNTTDFLTQYGAWSNGKFIGIDAGESWVDALPANLKGSYLWAEPAPTPAEAKLAPAVTKRGY